MPEAPSSALASVPPADVRPALENPAVAHCCEVWEVTLRRALKEGHKLVFARVAAHKAYQQALPPLVGLENIQNFIACVAHGMLQGSILHQHGARLLYAAQVAKGAAHSTGTQPKATAE
jgi:hypothetical protein